MLLYTSGTGNTTSTAAILTVTAVPAAPAVTTPVAYCQNATATLLTATGTGLLWYTAATGGTGSCYSAYSFYSNCRQQYLLCFSNYRYLRKPEGCDRS
jgi:hypothetical protein